MADEKTKPLWNDLSWNKRMAGELSEIGSSLTPGTLEGVLEAAGELKAVQLKIMLARLYTICNEAILAGGQPTNDEPLMEAIYKALQ